MQTLKFSNPNIFYKIYAQILSFFLLTFTMINYSNTPIFLLIGPSGVGKSTLISELAKNGLIFNYLITHTTRAIRPGETNGKDYFFINSQEYNAIKKTNGFIAPCSHYGNSYGISKEFIYKKLEDDCTLIGCLTAPVARELKTNLKQTTVSTIFITPSSNGLFASLNELEKRLLARNTETKENIKIRLQSAFSELNMQDSFDYKIVNDDLKRATQDLKKIIDQQLF